MGPTKSWRHTDWWVQAVMGAEVDAEIADPVKRARNAAARCLLFEVRQCLA